MTTLLPVSPIIQDGKLIGAVGFVTTLCVSPLITLIQNNGNELLGLPVYAQQVVAVIAVIFEIATMLYLHFALIRNRK